MSRTAEQLEDRLLAILPEPFHGLGALLGGPAGALAESEAVAETLAEMAVPSTSAGPWLTMIAAGQGIRRDPAESDAELLARVQAVPQGVTLAQIQSLTDDALTGTGVSGDVTDAWMARRYLSDDPGTEYTTDAYLDAHDYDWRLMPLGPAVVVWLDASLATSEEDHLIRVLRDARAAGVQVWTVESAAPVMGRDTDTP